MIQVCFKFEVRIMPLLAIEIERSINSSLENDKEMDHSVDAVIEIEYLGCGSITLHLPLIVSLESIHKALKVVYEEFRERNLLPA